MGPRVLRCGIATCTFCLQFTHPSFAPQRQSKVLSRGFPHWESTDLDFVRVWAFLYPLVELGICQKG